MTIVKIRNIEIDSHTPKICVPIAGTTRKDILNAANYITNLEIDMVEWRADWYADIFNVEEVKNTAKALRNILGEMPILFTFRTANEGGEKPINADGYVKLISEVAKTGYVDIVDVEVFTGDNIVKKIIEAAHNCGVKIVASNHDFDKTPKKDEIIKRLCKMQELGADILKIAVMPNSREDVITLLAATEEMNRKYARKPIVTISMGKIGIISRICCEIFGSAITFGTAINSSAPGQINVKDLKTFISLFHKNLSP